jgi:hypothetical protein
MSQVSIRQDGRRAKRGKADTARLARPDASLASNRQAVLRAAACGLVLSLVPHVSNAQSTPLAVILPELLGNTITLRPSSLPDQPLHVAHFRPGPDQLQVPEQVNHALTLLISTYPIGTPAGGFTYLFDPALGSLSRNSDSFGPSFAERALTTGKGKVSLGFGYQHGAYDTFEGLNLRQREIKFYVPHTDCCSPGTADASVPDNSRLTPPFEGDLIEASLTLDLVSDTSVLFASYGVSNRLDIGVAVPFLRVKVDASVLARIERLSTAQEPLVHQFPGTDPDQQVFRISGVASGLGDIVVRGKYAFTASTPLGLAAAVEARLPTGDETNLLGTGGVQTKVFGIASLHRGPVSPHVNAGWTFSSHGALPGAGLHDELYAAAGADAAITSRFTTSFDVLGRVLKDAGRMRLTEKTFEYALAGSGGGSGGGGGGGGGGRPQPTDVQRTTRTELGLVSGDLRLYLGAAGVRFNPWRTILVTANLLFPLTSAGLRDRVTPAIGIDYVF